MVLDIYTYRVHKTRCMGSEDFYIEEFSEEFPILFNYFKNYIQYTETHDWPKTFRCFGLKYDDWSLFNFQNGSWEYRHKKNNKLINIPEDVTYNKLVASLQVTEELHQRKRVSSEYYKWLHIEANNGNNTYYRNNIVVNHRNFLEAKCYGTVGNQLQQMYEALKDKDTFIYNSW